ncbi:autotransporter outer membrane beta-barrel domain-containing protein [Cupriavidus sp. BIC8F]|uniref:autotransporter outer membrane beta-barrel domain-containing protein n=1 Tax=Cupriavidus sp. BIC8F TaxID=3079014 RepID=UPI002916BED2|nr:autotransporter outer membrane beta-barrel domain-containing protein [Cupriavidus sp. BIC8F]
MAALSALLEAGLPMPLGRVTAEPQAQLVWQHLSVNDLDDGISSVAFRNANGWLGRVGVRVETQLQRSGVTWLPCLRANVLKSFGGTDQTVFAGTDAIGTAVASTAAQLGLGVAARMNRSLSLHATAAYTTNLDTATRNSLSGYCGARWSW